MIREYQRRRDFLVPALNQIPGVRCFKPQGAFYVYPDIRAFLHNGLKTSDDFAGRLLSEAHVAVTPGSGFGMDGFIRISYAAAYTALEEAVRRLAEFLAFLGVQAMKSINPEARKRRPMFLDDVSTGKTNSNLPCCACNAGR